MPTKAGTLKDSYLGERNLISRIKESAISRSKTWIRDRGLLYATARWSHLLAKTLPERIGFQYSKEEQTRLRQAIRGEGFHLIHDFISSQEAAQILAKVKEHEEKGWFINEGISYHFYDRLHEIIPPAQLEALRQRIQPIVETYLGMPLKNRPDVSIYKTNPSDKEFSSFCWHHDGKFCNVNVVIYLTDVNDEEDGPFEAVPNTFKHIHSGYNYETSRIQIPSGTKHRSALGKAGDAVFFDTASAHRGGLVKRQPRYALSFYFDPYDNYVFTHGKKLQKFRWK